MIETDNAEYRLAQFAAETNSADIPATARTMALALIIDAIACRFAGSATDDGRRFAARAATSFGPGENVVPGIESRLSGAGAAFVNGYLIAAPSYCDTYAPARCHVSPGIVGAAIVAAAEGRRSGRDMVDAVALGAEVCVDIARAFHTEQWLDRGWHAPGVAGCFGAAATAGRLIGLDAPGIRHAMGFAGAQAGGTFAQWATDGLKFTQARGAFAGYIAAGLAAAGLTAADRALTDTRGGLLRAMADAADTSGVAAIDIPPVADWESPAISLRSSPVASPLQPLANLAQLLIDRGVTPQAVTRIDLTVPAAIVERHGHTTWATAAQAQMSAPFLISAALQYGTVGLDLFTPERVDDSEVLHSAQSLVFLHAAPALHSTDIAIDIAIGPAGTQIHESLSGSGGHARRGMPTDTLDRKFLQCAHFAAIPPDAAAELLEQLRRLDTVTDVAPVLAAMGARR